MKQRRWGWGLLLALLSLFLISDQTTAAIDQGVLSVKPIYPENQISPQNGYYLLVKPGQKQKISFLVSNLQGKEQTVRITPGMYITNEQGDLVLTTNPQRLDPSLPANLMDMGVKPVYVKIAANQTIQVNQEYQIPNQTFKGLIYGGIRVTSGLQNSQELKNNKTQTMINTYGQIDTGVILTMDRNYPQGNLIIKKVLPISSDPSPSFQVKIQNSQGTIIDQLNLKAKITNERTGRLQTNLSKFELTKTYYGYTVAPYSNFNLTLNMGKKRLFPGKYNLELTGTAHGHSFKQKYHFIVARNKAQKINQDNSQVKPDYTWLYLIIIVAAILMIIVLAVLVYLFGQRHFASTSKSEIPQPDIKAASSAKSSEAILNVNRPNHRYGSSNVPKRKRK